MAVAKKNIIYQGNSIISVENLPDYSHPVVIKKLSKKHSSQQKIRSLEKEYEMTRDLNAVEGVRKVLKQMSIDYQPALILEYIDGKTLRDYIKGKTFDLRERLNIAFNLTCIIERIHKQNIIHLDVNSKNIIIGTKQETIHLIDFGSASRMENHASQKIKPDQMLGNLSYISPEQTGRINRAVDEHSDLYSLGIVLYELFTGHLPFVSKNPAELIHQHITLTPSSPSDLKPEVPDVISNILLKLLSKDAEDRYKSATGVKTDLEKCLDGLTAENTVKDFTIGETDFSSRFKFPQKLYGRESELNELTAAYKNASIEKPSIFFIAGYSGIGKTALVEEIQKPVSENKGYFIRGKFDQYLRTTPYSGITQAFEGFILQILAEPEEIFKKWQETIQGAVGDWGKVLIELIPAVENLLGTQPDIPQLGGHEAANRFNYVFISFLSAVATKEHPLAIFIDDLQWIDAASLRLLKVIETDFTQPGLLVVGAYRDNEVDNSHPLMDFINKREEKSMELRLLKLNDLNEKHLEALMSDTLKTGEGIKELEEIIFEKTQGNPFFSRRLLTTLNEEGRIVYDSEINNWVWNITDIKSETIADNVADLLVKNIAALPDEIKNILTLAACIGNRFNIHTLALISDLNEPEISKLLTLSLSGQYVVESGETFEFVHDQVQHAAHSLLSEEKSCAKHLEIGRVLVANIDSAALEEHIFDIVGHYDLGASLLSDVAEKLEVAKLYLTAGHTAKLNSAFDAAAGYLREAVRLLGENAWQEQYGLTLDVYTEMIEVSNLNIQSEEVEALFDTITENARQDVDASLACKVLIVSCVARHELDRSISLAERYLKQLNVNLDSERESDLSIAELRDLPPMENREKLAAMEILMVMTTPVLMSAPERLTSVIFTMLNLISQYGNNTISSFAYAWYAQILCITQQYQEGNNFGQLAVDLIEKYSYPSRVAEIMNILVSNVRHWWHPIHDQIIPLKTYYRMAMQAGDFEYASYCQLNYTWMSWGSGKHIDLILTEIEPCISMCQSKNQQFSLQAASMLAQLMLNLTGRSHSTSQLEGKWFSEKTMIAELRGNQYLLSLYGVLKMKLCYIFGNTEAAYRQTQDVLKYRDSLNPHYLYTKTSFYGALSCIAIPPDEENDADQQERLENLRLFEEELKLWAEVCPMNYQHQYDLVIAEKSRINNDNWKALQLYKTAIKGAKKNQFVHDEAMANELLGKFWLEQANEQIAEIYLSEARVLYSEWGAEAKVEHLEKGYPQCFQSKTVNIRKTDFVDDASQYVSRFTPIQLDMESIISASQMLSAETDLEQLLTQMITLVMTNSGAETAVLLLKQENDWFVQVRGDSTSKKYDILLNQPFEPADSETALVPELLFNYCLRSKELVVLSDVRNDSRFAEDKLIFVKDIKSVLCLPILNKGEIIGLLYLENNQMINAFNTERIGLLKHLASQFGISVINSLLYNTLQDKVGELQMSEERFRSFVENANETIVVTQDETVKYSNPKLIELTGYSQEELGSRDFIDFIHPEDRETVMLEYRDRLSGERPAAIYSIRIVTKDGSEKNVLVSSALIDWDGRPATLAMLTDITELKDTENKLLKSEEHFRKMMEQSPLAMAIFSPDGQFTDVNPAWYRQWGLNREEATEFFARYNLRTDKQLEDLGVAPLVERAYAGESVVLPPIEYFGNRTLDELGVEDVEATSRWVQIHLYPIKDENGSVASVVNTNVDITEIKRAEQEVQEQKEILARVGRTSRMGQLTGSIAHELSQPLTGILSSAQALEIILQENQEKSGKMAKIVERIIADAKRSRDVIHSLRGLYGGQKAKYHPSDINTVVDATIQLLRSEIILHQIKLKKECSPALPQLYGNTTQLQEVLLNLMMNAIQAMKEVARDNRYLLIKTNHKSNNVKTWVEDRGPGIPPDKIDRIFEPLATWKPGGIGMGLAISNSIIEAHGGKMWAENKPEGGARVGFILPALKKGQN
jgi:PAS domain S-box-containing protein